MMRTATFALLASCIALATSTVFIKGPCPAFESAPDFSFEGYKGVWYEIAKYPDDWENRGDCGRIEYYRQNNVFNLSNVVDKKRVYVTGTARLEGGVLYHDSSDLQRLEGSYVIPINVVSVDYNDYAVLYECIYNETTKMRHDFSWILTRNRNKKDDVIRKTADIIKSLGYIDTSKYNWENLSDEQCLE